MPKGVLPLEKRPGARYFVKIISSDEERLTTLAVSDQK